MAIRIKITDKSSTPKYEQLVNEIIRNIRAGHLLLGDKLPSIHEVASNYDISRDTVVIAYNELKARGIISPKHGKGFYVSSTTFLSRLKIFLLFDVMNGYKEVLYRSLINSLGHDYQVDIYFHYYNIKVFEQLIINNINKYGFYVIMPHFNEDVSGIVNSIAHDKLIIIDKDIKSPYNDYAAVYQDFESDIYLALNDAFPLLLKYSNIKFISNHNFQFIPEGMESGFYKFCREHKLNHKVYENIDSSLPAKGDAFLVVSDHDLIQLIKTSIHKKWELGKDIGILSYDETPLKEILAGGISVVTTDFRKMGETVGEMIRNRLVKKVANPCLFISRKSL
ncbi:MAG TPA: GntR family transcriptional regulator [Bacteroidales bacterium]|nr:GntR family transcriptional regulator [Bacteroidales bacterium]